MIDFLSCHQLPFFFVWHWYSKAENLYLTTSQNGKSSLDRRTLIGIEALPRGLADYNFSGGPDLRNSFPESNIIVWQWLNLARQISART